MMDKENYIPGTCNIGIAERNRRKRTGWVGVGLTIITFILLIYFKPPAFLRSLVFFPAFSGVLGLLQGYLKFCVYFGINSIFNFSELGKENKVEEDEFRRKDRLKAIQILVIALAISILFTLVCVVFI